MPQTDNTTAPNIFNNLTLGLKVLFSECRWLFLKALRAYEIRQMRKRLEEEYASLGVAFTDQVIPHNTTQAHTLPEPSPETELALKQIAFLKEEIAFLQTDRKTMRAEFISRRKQKLGLD